MDSELCKHFNKSDSRWRSWFHHTPIILVYLHIPKVILVYLNIPKIIFVYLHIPNSSPKIGLMQRSSKKVLFPSIYSCKFYQLNSLRLTEITMEKLTFVCSVDSVCVILNFPPSTPSCFLFDKDLIVTRQVSALQLYQRYIYSM